ncbi:DUF2505 domain-containing protein [uncultured Tessaracoccus sp.]|uniref:DUF2505 domain-containing protein n=1 Tax=uncultured Tessaracoccus sp. TaxID=905023 RepID=UPI002627EE3C|nr:DUF2505 domain-containing protein [uncultured Tessaracoccus sp.]
MKLAFQHSYPAPPRDVAALLRNEAFLDDVAQHAGAVQHTVVTGDVGTRIDMTLPAPDHVQKVLGKTVKVSILLAFSDETSDGTIPGTMNVDVPGMPVEARATSKLVPTSTGTVGDYAGELKVKIPLVGKKVEAQVEPFIVQAFAGMEKRAHVWLTR